MNRLIILLALVGVCLASYKDTHKKARKCYMCEYRPAKTTTFKVPVKEEFTYKVSRTVEECWTKKVLVKPAYDHYGSYFPAQYKVVKECRPKVVYDIKKGEKTRYEVKSKTGRPGGFDACKGPLEPWMAMKDGVDTWKCHDNCYIRTDKHNNVLRGCYKGEFNLDPNSTKRQTLHGFTYKFCFGELCNGH